MWVRAALPGALLVQWTEAWTTISQSQDSGATLAALKATVGGAAETAALTENELLGYLWHSPSDPAESRGLGGGISYAVDPALCADLSLDQSCLDAIGASLSVWSSLHPRIAFTDVSSQCEKVQAISTGADGARSSDCTLNELWISTASGGFASSDGAQQVALAVPTAYYSSADFRSTNGERPHYTDGSGSIGFRKVWEVRKSRVNFNRAPDVCWYLDGGNCTQANVARPCASFEATLVHEIGHALGLGHPDVAKAGGGNLYHALLAAGGALNATSSLRPWEAVAPDLPEDASVDVDAQRRVCAASPALAGCTPGVRPSVMLESVEWGKAQFCPTDDDLEGLYTLYPYAGLSTSPGCTRAPPVCTGAVPGASSDSSNSIALAVAAGVSGLMLLLAIPAFAYVKLRRKRAQVAIGIPVEAEEGAVAEAMARSRADARATSGGAQTVDPALAAAIAASLAERGFVPNAPVNVHSLVSKRKLNGKRGVVRGSLESGRLSVEVGGELLALKPENLLLVGPACSPAPSPPGVRSAPSPPGVNRTDMASNQDA